MRLGRGFPNNALMHQIITPPPIAYDATGAGILLSSGLNGTFTHTVGQSANLILLGVSTFASGPFSLSASIGGTPMTDALGGHQQYYSNGVNSSGQVGLFYLFNPPHGSNTITLTGSGSSSYALTANSVSYCGVGSLGTAVFAEGSSATASQTGTGRSARGAFFQVLGAYANLSSYNQNQRWNTVVNGNERACLLGDTIGSPSATMSASLSSTVWGSIVVPLNPTHST